MPLNDLADARPPSMFLTAAEVRDLTGREHRDAQRKALDSMGIRYAERPDGSLVVLRRLVELVLGLLDDPQGPPSEPEPEVLP